MGILSFIGRTLKKVFSIIPAILDWLTPDVPDRQGLTVSRDGSNLAIPVVYGKQKVGAIKVHKYVTDRSGGVTNEFLHIICVLCEGEIEAVDELFFDDVSENDSRFRKDGTERYFTKSIHLGGADQIADAAAVAAIPNWTNTHRLRGLAYVYIRLEIDSDQTVWRGEPAITAIVRGKKILDTRSGLVAYSNNPSMCTRDYIVNSIYGKGLVASRLDDALFNSAADFCDQTTSVTRTLSRSFYDEVDREFVNAPPTTQTLQITRFTCNLVIDTGRTVFQNTQELLGTFRGILPPTFNTGPTVEDIGPPVVNIDADDIVGSISVDTGTINDRKNRIVVRFPSELADFEYDEAFYPIDTDPIRATWLEEDGDVNLEGVFTFNGISNKAEALQAAEIIAKRSRFNIVVNLSLQPEFIVYDVAQIISMTDETHGWIEKPFRINRKVITEDGLVRVTLAEHEDSIYPWSGRSYDDRQGGTNLGNPEVVDAPTNVLLLPDNTLTTTGALTWEYATNAFVRRFNVVISKTINSDGSTTGLPQVIIDVDVFDRSYIVPTLDSGTYAFSIFAISTIGIRSPATVFIGLLDSPTAPTSIIVNPSNFELEVLPQLSGIGIGTEFEFALGNTDTILARGASVRFVGLIPNTLYTVFARSVNAYGTSIWVSVDATTTNDAQPIIDLIGEDIAGEILPTVLAELQDDLQVIVDMSLTDYSTTTEVITLIDNSISLVNDAVGEDIRIGIVEGVIDVFVDLENQEDIRTETLQRTTEATRLTAEIDNNTSEITTVNQAVADETSARTTQINQLTATVNNNESNSQAQFVTINQTVADETTARTTSINQLSATVNGNTATITTTNEALVSEAATRALQVFNLQAADTAQVVRISSVESDSEGNSTAINNLEGSVNNPVTGLTATFNIAQSATVTAGGNSNSITAIQNSVNNPISGLSATFTLAGGANTTANGAASAVAGFNTAIAGSNNQSQAELLLSSAFVPELGTSFSRAFLGVTNTVSGVSTINGILVDGATNALEFRANTFRLTDTSGNVRLVYNTSQNVWNFTGDISASNITGSTITGGSLNINNNTTISTAGFISTNSMLMNGRATIQNIDVIGPQNRGALQVQPGSVRGTQSNGTDSAFFSESGGYNGVAGTTYRPFTGSHNGLSKYIPEVGDIICDDELVEILGISDAVFTHKISEVKNDPRAIGIYTNNIDYHDYEDTHEDFKFISFNSLGEGAMNVCDQNGDIMAGDLIVTSDINGKGMKQDDNIFRNITIAKARHAVKFDYAGQTKQIAVIYKCG